MNYNALYRLEAAGWASEFAEIFCEKCDFMLYNNILVSHPANDKITLTLFDPLRGRLLVIEQEYKLN